MLVLILKKLKIKYIFFNLGNNYIRGENMNSKRIKSFMVPIVYGGCVLIFLFSIYFAGRFARRVLFTDDSNLKYVDGEITKEGDNSELPVVSTSSQIVRPYLDNTVSIVKSFYDYKGDSTTQEESIIVYDGTYMQNSGVDYSGENIFDVISILDGTVISVEDNELLGTTVEIRHSNDLISVYQSLSDVIVKKDDLVIQGQIIAKSGTSNINKELENHLHFELYYKGKIVNPEEYYNKSVDEL